MWSDNHIDNAFQRLNPPETEPAPFPLDGWLRLETELDKAVIERAVRRRLWRFFAAEIVVVALVGLGWLLWPAGKATPVQQPSAIGASTAWASSAAKKPNEAGPATATTVAAQQSPAALLAAQPAAAATTAAGPPATHAPVSPAQAAAPGAGAPDARTRILPLLAAGPPENARRQLQAGHRGAADRPAAACWRTASAVGAAARTGPRAGARGHLLLAAAAIDPAGNGNDAAMPTPPADNPRVQTPAAGRPPLRSAALGLPLATGPGAASGAQAARPNPEPAAASAFGGGTEEGAAPAADGAAGLAHLALQPVAVQAAALSALPAVLAPTAVAPQTPAVAVRQPRLYVSLVGAPDVSTVKFADVQHPFLNVGVLLEYRFANRLRVSTGLLRANKEYYARRQDYDWTNYPRALTRDFEWVDGACTVLDVPLNLRYDAVVRPQARLFGSVGLSSFFMQRERYVYDYQEGGAYAEWDRSFVNENRHLLSILNLSLGYERSLGTHWSVQAEPYAKLPLGGVGVGKVRLTSGGVFFGVKYGF